MAFRFEAVDNALLQPETGVVGCDCDLQVVSSLRAAPSISGKRGLQHLQHIQIEPDRLADGVWNIGRCPEIPPPGRRGNNRAKYILFLLSGNVRTQTIR